MTDDTHSSEAEKEENGSAVGRVAITAGDAPSGNFRQDSRLYIRLPNYRSTHWSESRSGWTDERILLEEYQEALHLYV